MNYKKIKTIALIRSDLSRQCEPTLMNFVKFIVFNASFKVSFWYRICHYYNGSFWGAFFFIIFRHEQYKTGIQLPVKTKIGGGLLFAHYSCIVINDLAKIGNNVTIFQGVTIGSVRGKGTPTIGNNVVISSGAKVLGNIRVGNNCFIGANAVVVKDVPDGTVVGGVPAIILNRHGKENVKLYTSVFM